MTEASLPTPEDGLPCSAFVEMVTDYLDDAMPLQLRARVDEHLAICPGCHTVLEQIRSVIAMTGRLTETDVEALAPGSRAELMDAFRAACN
jgi:predicted anti-sigma-YlaC factor YlaD